MGDTARNDRGARYVHTNLIARDWRRLARFYQDVFGCVPVPPERNLSGTEMEAGTGVPGARLQGMHLRLPGTGPDGPTLESSSIQSRLLTSLAWRIGPGSRTSPSRLTPSPMHAIRCCRTAAHPSVRW